MWWLNGRHGSRSGQGKAVQVQGTGRGSNDWQDGVKCQKEGA